MGDIFSREAREELKEVLIDKTDSQTSDKEKEE